MISPRKVLAIKLRSLGDTVLMTASLNELRRAYPSAEIHAVAQTPWTALLERQPGVRRVWPYERHKDAAARAKAVARLGLQLRREQFDCVVNFHASPSSAALAFATGAKVRAIHFHGHRDKDRFSTLAIPGKGTLEPVIERDMNTLRALGLDIPRGKLPRLSLDHEELDRALDRIEERRLSGPLLAIGIGASRPTKSWPIERFAEIARSWCEKMDGSVLALGSREEQVLCGDFVKLAGNHPRIQYENSLSVRELAAILRQSAVMLGNDSGPRHLAVAVGTPTVTLFGPEHPFEWHPYPADRHPHFFVDNLACRRDADPGMPAWCALHQCVVEHHKCMEAIGTEEVLEKVLQVSGK